MYMLSRNIGLLFVVGLFSACAASGPTLSPGLQSEYDAPLYCEGEQQCKTYWERAAYFVSANAGFKVQTHTDMLIETYSPTGYSVYLGFKITREPLGEGRYQIWTNAWCDNLFGCKPDHREAIARAKRYIRTGQK